MEDEKNWCDDEEELKVEDVNDTSEAETPT